MIRILKTTPMLWSSVMLITWVTFLSIGIINLSYEVFATFLIASLLSYLVVKIKLATKSLWFLVPLAAWLIMLGIAVINIPATVIITFLLICLLFCEIAEIWSKTSRFSKN